MKPGIINTAKMSNTQILPIIAWLRANGIEPELMPRDQTIIITGRRIIYIQVKQRQMKRGGKNIVPVTIGNGFHTVAREIRTKRIRVSLKEIL